LKVFWTGNWRIFAAFLRNISINSACPKRP
jgi:hypothetical protein